MEKENLNITVMSGDGKPVEVILREGKALELFQPKNVTFKGDIASVKEFISKHYNADVEECHIFDGVVQIDSEKNQILFCDFPKESTGVTNIVASLTPNKKLESFMINEDNFINQKSVANLIRKNAILFKDSTIVRGLIKTLDELSLSIQNDIVDNNDRRGNVELSYKRVIKEKKGVLPEFITLFCPLFEGMAPIEIKLEIELEIKNNVPMYAFYCLEMDLMIDEQKKKAFGENVPEYIHKHFVVYNV